LAWNHAVHPGGDDPLRGLERAANERPRECGPGPFAPLVGCAVAFTGRSYVLARSPITVNCDDPMVNCMALHHILGEN